MLPLQERTTFIDDYIHIFVPLKTFNHEGNIEATGMFTTNKIFSSFKFFQERNILWQILAIEKNVASEIE